MLNSLSSSYTFPILGFLATIHHDSSRCVPYCKIGTIKTENSEINTMSHGVPMVSPRIHYDSWWCYYDATTIAPQHNRRTVILYLWWIEMNLGWIMMSDDTPIDPKRPRMTTNTTTVPLGMILIQQRYDLGHAHNPSRVTPTSLNGLISS